MGAVNHCQFIGRVGHDIDLKRIPRKIEEGEFVKAEFTLYIKLRRAGRTDAVSIEAYGKLAAVCSQYIGKGSHVAVDTEVKQSRWTDEAGKNHSRHTFVLHDIEFLDPLPGRAEAPAKPDDTTD